MSMAAFLAGTASSGSPSRTKRPRRAAHLAAVNTLASLLSFSDSSPPSTNRHRPLSSPSPSPSPSPSRRTPAVSSAIRIRSPRLSLPAGPPASARRSLVGPPVAPAGAPAAAAAALADWRLERLAGTEATVQVALTIADRMKLDRPHMAAKLLKLLPYDAKMTRHWGPSVSSGQTAVWTLRGVGGGAGGILWVEISRTAKDVIGAIEVLWIDPRCRKSGLGSTLVQGVLNGHPEISTWTAFASQAARDVGLSAFWRKNGFSEELKHKSGVAFDGFFVRAAAVPAAPPDQPSASSSGGGRKRRVSALKAVQTLSGLTQKGEASGLVLGVTVSGGPLERALEEARLGGLMSGTVLLDEEDSERWAGAFEGGGGGLSHVESFRPKQELLERFRGAGKLGRLTLVDPRTTGVQWRGPEGSSVGIGQTGDGEWELVGVWMPSRRAVHRRLLVVATEKDKFRSTHPPLT